jgi:hypothetical protein
MRSNVKRTLATALTGAALAGAPPAQAVPIDSVGPQAAPADSPAPASGFDVSSAAIGAAAGTGLLLALLGAGGLARRRPAGHALT